MTAFGFLPRGVLPGEYVRGDGALGCDPLQPDGQWAAFLPEYESQYGVGWDSHGCTVYGTLNAVEVLEARLFGAKPNYADRFTYNLIPVDPPGGSPHVAAETVRKFGLVPEPMLPAATSLADHATPRPVTEALLAEGRAWLARFEFGHEWLWSSEPSPERRDALIKDALRCSPVGISVTAWHWNGDGYVDAGFPNNHWCLCVGYEERPDGLYLKVFDSYGGEEKLLHPSHRIAQAKRYRLAPRRPAAPRPWVLTLRQWLTRLLRADSGSR